jgi:hypothetical protein
MPCGNPTAEYMLDEPVPPVRSLPNALTLQETSKIVYS